MRRLYVWLTFGVSLYFSAIHGQTKIPEFGNIDIADLELKECLFDKGADAMNLIRTETISCEETYFTYESKITTEYRRRIKIFNEKGFKNASVVIPYASPNGDVKVTDIEAIIYTLDGQGNIVKQKLDKDEIFTDKSKAKLSVNKISFTFPGLKPGAVIEYRYTKIDRKILYIEPRVLTEDIPTLFYKISVSIPSHYLDMGFHFVTDLPLEKDSSIAKYNNPAFNKESISFVIRDIPRFRPEPLMSSLADNLQRIEISLSPASFFAIDPQSKWDFFRRLLLKAPFFGMQFNQPLDAVGGFMDSLNSITDTLDKIKAIYTYIKHNIQWNNEQTFFSANLDGCWKNKSGNSAEINISLLNMLRKTGVVCYAMLISTRNHGNPDKMFPNMGQFNGVDVIVFYRNMAYVLDCTQKNLSFKTPPYNILNRNVYLMDQSLKGWLNITSTDALINENILINAGMDSVGTITAKADILYGGIAKADELTRENNTKEENNNRGMIEWDAPGVQVDTVLTEHDTDDSDTLIKRMQFHYTLLNTGDIYFIDPFSLSMFRKKIFTDTVRNTDIDFGCNQSYSELMNVKIPAKFNIEELPADKEIMMPDSSAAFTRKFSKDDNGVHAQILFQLNKAIFTKEEYIPLKDFFDKIYALLNDEIVVKRTGK